MLKGKIKTTMQLRNGCWIEPQETRFFLSEDNTVKNEVEYEKVDEFTSKNRVSVSRPKSPLPKTPTL